MRGLTVPETHKKWPNPQPATILKPGNQYDLNVTPEVLKLAKPATREIPKLPSCPIWHPRDLRFLIVFASL